MKISLMSSETLSKLDTGGHSGLPTLVLGSAYVSSKVDGLQVINGYDALGDAGGVSHSSVDQPPRITHTNRTEVLNRKVTIKAAICC
uniref:Uncharacterized protein n=1 Tax=Oncorhynchus kisutch TaxID=8019 RepID=A0A8C7D9V7_ONCKI